MKQHKVCMLGSFAVGKTSLVSRFVEGIFSEQYHTTLGVKVDRKDVEVDGESRRLVLWDLEGDDRFCHVRASYLRGSSGCLLVVDGTRPETVDKVLELEERLRETVGEVPAVVLVNKCDLGGSWPLDLGEITERMQGSRPVMTTSAKTGESVEDAFAELTRMIIRD